VSHIVRLSQGQSFLLDLIRGVSAQLVVIGHAAFAAGFPLRVVMQDLGVVLFFVLSGFLVTASALSKREYGFTDFIIDRGARMFVPYIPALFLIWFAGVVLSLPGPVDLSTFLANLFMLQDFPLHRYLPFPEIERLGSGRPLWSVAMEWWIYMGFAVVFFVGRLPLWGWLLAVVGAFVVAFNATVGMLSYTWAAGAFAAVLFHRLPRAPWALVAAVLALLCVYRWKISNGEFYDLKLNLLIALTFVASLKAGERLVVPRPLVVAAAGIAAFSYTLYLMHYTVLIATRDLDGLWRVLSVITLANVVSVTLYFAFERHYRRVARALHSWRARIAASETS
jgi:peptidoglycan/LPS O-acetylase OafA/YrhL